MELTTSLETEQHMAKELAAKLSDMGVELEESKQLVGSTRQVTVIRPEPLYILRLTREKKVKLTGK